MEAIMEAADSLFAERPYHQITMGTIAERLGWSRSNLHKYAATQEEVFLALHAAKNRAWIDELAEKLAGVRSSFTDAYADFMELCIGHAEADGVDPISSAVSSR